MIALRHPRRAAAMLVAAAVSLACAVPAAANAGTLAPAAATAYNSTPDCPVSATTLVCAWNLPADSSNPFSALDYGQCPYWAAEKYPLLVLDEILTDPLGENWNGGTWLEHAAEEGLSISTTPASGDLAVYQANAADPSGHVAYVEAVDGGAIIVSQMDGYSSAPFPALSGSTEYIDAANLAYYQQTYGLEFVSTGFASTTPLSYVEAPAAAPTVSTNTVTTTASSTPTPAELKAAAAKKRAAAAKKRKAEAAAKKRAAQKKSHHR